MFTQIGKRETSMSESCWKMPSKAPPLFLVVGGFRAHYSMDSFRPKNPNLGSVLAIL